MSEEDSYPHQEPCSLTLATCCSLHVCARMPLISGSQHYHSMVYRVLADLSKALINTISARRNLKPSTASHLQ